MSLVPGARFGPYEILAAIGAGGMGHVYRARDLKLGRDVAIKVLHPVFARDAERLARFEREARTLAAMNHPYIAQVYGVVELPADTGGQGIVLELVDGEDLSGRLDRGAIPLEEAVPIALQIATALEAAHELGIIHRDLKPANIKVRVDGTIKVLDFGLAKDVTPMTGAPTALENSPTITSDPVSHLGVILGTVAFMAPEAARGKPVDKRADIWAFGCVLYEMLTGRRAFQGDDVSETLAAVLRQNIDLRALPPATPTAVRRLIERCLQRDPKLRLRDIGEARVILTEPQAREGGEPGVPVATRSVVPGWRSAILSLWAAAATAALVAVTLLWTPWRSPARRSPIHVSIDLGARLRPGEVGPGTAISPDGRTLAFVGSAGPETELTVGTEPTLFVRRLDRLEPTPVPGTEGAFGPFFSPDGESIGFFTARALKTVSVRGGVVSTVCPAVNGRGGSWHQDGTIVFQPTPGPGPLMRVAASGGTPVPVTAREQPSFMRWPQVLPGGKAVLYTANADTDGFETANLVVQPLPDGTPKVVHRGGYYGRYVSTGHILFMLRGTLFAVPFDLDRLTASNEPPVPIVEGVLSNTTNGGAHFDVSAGGTLVYSSGATTSAIRPVLWMEASGATSPLRAAPSRWSHPRFSPKGDQLALTVNDGTQNDLWIYDWKRDTTTKFTSDPSRDTNAVWTPGGTGIVFASDRANRGIANLYWQRADGTGEVKRLTNSPHTQAPYSFHPSEQMLAFQETGDNGSADIMLLPLSGDDAEGWTAGTPRPFLASPATEAIPMFSPDGRWIAYQSSESGRMEIYVQPYPGPGGRWQVSDGTGGLQPAWSGTAPQLFFLQPQTTKVMVADHSVRDGVLRSEKPRVWSPTSYFTTGGVSRTYDVHPDGKRLAISTPVQSQRITRTTVIMVLDFFEQLRRLAPVTRPPG